VRHSRGQHILLNLLMPLEDLLWGAIPPLHVDECGVQTLFQASVTQCTLAGGATPVEAADLINIFRCEFPHAIVRIVEGEKIARVWRTMARGDSLLINPSIPQVTLCIGP
jgi:hypothetical protein